MGEEVKGEVLAVKVGGEVEQVGLDAGPGVGKGGRGADMGSGWE